MSKNVIIGILVAVVLLFLGYAAFQSNPSLVTVNPVATSTVDTSNTGGSVPNSPGPVRTPEAPSVETGTNPAVSNSTSLVSGKVTPNGALTTYWYEYGLTTSLGSRTTSQTIGSGFSSITAPGYITGLRASTQYYFRLNASNSQGTTRGSVNSFTTNTTPPPAGQAPSVQTNNASNIARATATINGHVDPQGYQTNYWFEFGETANLGNLTGFTSGGSGQDSIAVSAGLFNLKPLTKYYYRVNAQNQFGTVVGSVLSFTTTGPAGSSQPEVTTNSATGISTSTATLNGRLDPNGADTTYWFEYSTDSLLGNIIGTATANQTMNGADAAIGVKADISGLSRNTKYYFRLLGRNQFGTVTGNVQSFRTNR